MKSIGILFPIKETEEGGVFKTSKSTDSAIRSDLIALLTLRKGQRVMQSRMYSPIYDYLFEPLDQITTDQLNIKIREKVQEFIPQVEIRKINFTNQENQNLLSIEIVYVIIDFFDIEETLTIQIPRQF
jgi:phage baseplate assembly protein W